MCLIKQRSCYSFWQPQDYGTTGAALQQDCGIETAIPRQQCFKIAILWPGLTISGLGAQRDNTTGW